MQVMFLFKYKEKTTVGFFLLLIFHNVPQQTNCTIRYISSFNQSLNHHISRKKLCQKLSFRFSGASNNSCSSCFCQIKQNNPVSRAMWEFFSNFAVEVFVVQNLLNELELGSKLSTWQCFWSFCQKWMSPISPKIAVRFMCLTISPKLLTKCTGTVAFC